MMIFYNVIMPLGDKKVITQLNYGQFFLYHNDKWHKIFYVYEQEEFIIFKAEMLVLR